MEILKLESTNFVNMTKFSYKNILHLLYFKNTLATSDLFFMKYIQHILVQSSIKIIKYLLPFSKWVGSGPHKSQWISFSLVFFPVKQDLQFVFSSFRTGIPTAMSFFYKYYNPFCENAPTSCAITQCHSSSGSNKKLLCCIFILKSSFPLEQEIRHFHSSNNTLNPFSTSWPTLNKFWSISRTNNTSTINLVPTHWHYVIPLYF